MLKYLKEKQFHLYVRLTVIQHQQLHGSKAVKRYSEVLNTQLQEVRTHTHSLLTTPHWTIKTTMLLKLKINLAKNHQRPIYQLDVSVNRWNRKCLQKHLKLNFIFLSSTTKNKGTTKIPKQSCVLKGRFNYC